MNRTPVSFNIAIFILIAYYLKWNQVCNVWSNNNLKNPIFNIRYKWASDAWTFWNMTSQIVHNVKVSVCILWILKGLNLCSGKFWSWQTCVISILSKNETVLTSSNFLFNRFIETCVPRYHVTYKAMQTYTFLLIFIYSALLIIFHI